MGQRKVARRKLQIHQAGDLREVVTLKKRGLESSTEGGSIEALLEQGTIRASVDTRQQSNFMRGGVNVKEQQTHIFTTRRTRKIDVDTILEFKGEHYKVLSIEESDGRGLFLKLNCELLGDNTLPINN